jgi:hypothetical protein
LGVTKAPAACVNCFSTLNENVLFTVGQFGTVYEGVMEEGASGAVDVALKTLKGMYLLMLYIFVLYIFIKHVNKHKQQQVNYKNHEYSAL